MKDMEEMGLFGIESFKRGSASSEGQAFGKKSGKVGFFSPGLGWGDNLFGEELAGQKNGY